MQTFLPSDLCDRDRRYVMSQVIYYLLRVKRSSASKHGKKVVGTLHTLKAKIAPFLTTEQVELLRDHVISDFNVCVLLKSTMLAYLRNEIHTPAVLDMYAKYNAGYLIEFFDQFKSLKKQKQLKGVNIPKARFEFIPLPEMVRRLAGDALLAQRTFIGKFVSKKFWFLIKTNSIDREETVRALEAKGLQAFYAAIPFKSLPHVINGMKRAIHNEGINLILYHTVPKRARLRANGGVTLVPDIDGSLENIADDRGNDHELYMSIQEIHNRLHGKEKAAFEILSQTNADYVKYWRHKGTKAANPEELYTLLGSEKYMKGACSFLGWNNRRMQEFIRGLSEQI